MLETVKQYINDIDNISFNLYFVNYMIKMQDIDLENEFKHVVSRNCLSVSNMNKLISNTYEGLVNS
mgnify:CR=1 FL=1